MRGKAWSGTGPVTHVDVSLTGEGDWHPARVEPPSGPYHWQDWSFDWAADEIGRHTLRARATDAAGHTQPEVPPWNRLGYGNNADRGHLRRRGMSRGTHERPRGASTGPAGAS